MSLLADIRSRFATALKAWDVDPTTVLGMIRPTQDAKFGDYQANLAMPLAKTLGRAPREIADELVARVDWGDLCRQVEVAGPGFINLTIAEAELQRRLTTALSDDRLGVSPAPHPQTLVIDFSSPNVAKPMHVGHIRSTVIGDSLSRIARFLGHRVISDNHLGDWGTQFGMIIYGYKHFRNDEAYRAAPVQHLSELYRQVRKVVDYHAARHDLPKLEQQLAHWQQQLQAAQSRPEPSDKGERKQHQKETQRCATKVAELSASCQELRDKIAGAERDPHHLALAQAHADIHQKVLEETAKLHAGDPENRRLWEEFLPHCSADIQRIYDRLDIQFDVVLGESFYHDQLQTVVDDFRAKGLSEVSQGAVCVFLPGHDAPMLIQKSDGAFLYATTDLATIKYRAEQWQPDQVLYVVDHRQHEHFEKLFAAAARWGYDQIQLKHISFGTVLGEDGRPFKTRSGDTVGLESLLDEAEERARGVLQNLASDPQAEPWDQAEIERVARVIGIGALKFADLSQNRSSDYTFSYDKMLELKGFTATYLQYLYARVQGIYRKENWDPRQLQTNAGAWVWEQDVERQLALALARFGETLEDVLVDFRPNLLAQYLFELAQTFFRFYDQCPVLFAERPEVKQSRLQLCELTARTVRTGLQLLGIGVVERM